MSQAEVKALLEKALAELKTRDLPTFGDDIGERPMVFRIAHYLQVDLAKQAGVTLSVDCDYNRQIDEIKELPRPKVETVLEGGKKKKRKRFFPDIVIHKRRHKRNVLVCEIKRIGDSRDPNDDRDRLRILTSKENHFGYRLGAFVLIEQARRHIEIEYFREGKATGERRVL